MNKVVVTGGSGRVGLYVVRQLMKTMHVVVADLVAPQNIEVEFIQTNVMHLDEVRHALKGADAVIHLAALDFDWKAASEKYIDVNVRGTWHVLQVSQEQNIEKVVLCSSVSASGLSEMRPDWIPQSLPVDELHLNKPVQAYSVSKILMEQMAKSFVDGYPNMNVICLRPLAVVLNETLAEYIDFVDAEDRHWLFYYVTAEDVATAFEAAVNIKGLRFGTFYLSADDTSHPEDTFTWYQNKIGKLPEIKNPKLYQNYPRASIFSNRQAKDILGWKPTSDFNQLRELNKK